MEGGEKDTEGGGREGGREGGDRQKLIQSASVSVSFPVYLSLADYRWRQCEP